MSYGRRKFLKQSAMFTATVAASRTLTHSDTACATTPNCPFQVLVLGDSVMWGQGLTPAKKFYSIVQEWLKGVVQRDVNVTVMAHSGASILPVEESATGCDGEVNISWPTINTQRLDAALKYRRAGIDPRQVDLVLVNGGINDVGASNLVNPFFRSSEIKQGAEKYCYSAMRDLLLEIADTFCNARIVVTGYFPIISIQTPSDMLIRLIFAVLDVPKVGRLLLVKLFELARRGIGLDQKEAGPLLERAAELSDIWYRESTLALQKAVKEVNETLTASSRRIGCDEIRISENPLDRRVVYASAVFKPENSFAVNGTSYLWGLLDTRRHVGVFAPPIARLDSEDELFGKRAELCACPDARKRGIQLQICERAGTAHPNVAGAQEYARAIKAQLALLLPFTGWTASHVETAAALTVMPPPPPDVPVANDVQPSSLLRGIDHAFFAQATHFPEVIAHRGGAGEWPGETLYAYQEAVKSGVDILEMDVYLTKDDDLVLMHNPTVKETTNGKGLIATKTVSELKDLDAGYWWSDDGKKSFKYRGKGITVPTLKEIFEAFPNMRMNIEMKLSKKSPVTRLVRLLEEHQMTDRVLVASFSTEYLRAFRQACPRAATSASTGELLEFFLKNNSLTNGSFRPECDALQVLNKLQGQRFVTRRFVDRAHRLNLPVHPWTVNDRAEMSRMISLGVDGIITDYPTRLLALVERPLPG
jgi:glycerophosphoryl diester phosphodiesterase